MRNFRHLNLDIILLKTIYYRLISFGIMAGFVYVLTRDIKHSLQLSVALEIVKVCIYFIYECVFDKKFKLSKDEGFVLWATGCSGAGKTTLMDAVKEELDKSDRRTQRLDGDIVRSTLCNDLGFSQKDRNTNITRVTFVAKLLSKNGTGVLCSFISPYRDIRQHVREQTTNFIELHLVASKQALMERDPKGLYKKAKEGKIKNLTGFDGEFQVPYKPELAINTEVTSIEESVQIILDYLKKRRLI